MRYNEKAGVFVGRALVTLCFACLSVMLLNMPEIARCAGIMVQGNLNLNGNNVTIDSYSSSDPTESVNGQWAASVSGDSGDVICMGGITNSVSVGNALIYGRLYTGAGVSMSIGANGAVGTHEWVAGGGTGIETGYLVPNVNFSFPNITLPPGYPGFLIPAGGAVVTTNSGVLVTNNYAAILAGGNYLSTTGLGNTIVTSPSTLVLPNGYSIANLTIVTGASLTVYIGGAGSVSININTISNQGGIPSGLVIYCTSDVTSLLFSGGAAFSGVLFAPNAIATIIGGASEIDYSGAIMLKSLAMNGHVNFHFDQALVQQGIVPPYPSPAASLMTPGISGSSQFQFNVSGVAGFSYTIETSSNLTDWVPVFTNTSPFTFTDTNASAAQNFYRAVYYQ